MPNVFARSVHSRSLLRVMIVLAAMAGPWSMAAPAAAGGVVSEICDNCVDDNSNGFYDRNEASCKLPSGSGAGLGDVTRGKALVKCAAAIAKNGTAYEAKRLEKLQKALDAVLSCVQTKNASAKCVTSAQTAYEKTLAGFAKDDAALAAKIEKACGPPAITDPTDLTGISGLGYGTSGPTSPCGIVGAAIPTDAASVATCVSAIHACRAAEMLGIEMPRAAGLLTVINHAASDIPCLSPTEVGGATNLGDPKTGKLAAKCETTLKKAGAKLVATEVKAMLPCVNGAFTCVQVAPNDATCLPKAKDTCDKIYSKLVDQTKGLDPVIVKSVVKGCEPKGLEIGDLVPDDGLAIEAIQSACAAIGVPNVEAGGQSIALCMAAFHRCRAGQLLEAGMPRWQEMILLAGHAVLP